MGVDLEPRASPACERPSRPSHGGPRRRQRWRICFQRSSGQRHDPAPLTPARHARQATNQTTYKTSMEANCVDLKARDPFRIAHYREARAAKAAQPQGEEPCRTSSNSTTWLDRRTGRGRRARPTHRSHRRRLALEPLESRALLSLTTWTVNSLGDTGTGSGTSGDLRYVITQADKTTGDNTINFSVTGRSRSTRPCRT